MDFATFWQSDTNREMVTAVAGCFAIYLSIGREDKSTMAVFGIIGLALLAYAANLMLK
jgi:drug/metabolite transporter superfamily protein YnfA